MHIHVWQNNELGGAHEILSHHGLNYPIMLHHTSRNVTPPPPTTRTPTPLSLMGSMW